MADKNSDYKKNNFNLNDFLPTTNKGEFLESLNKNLFNRYLTKDEFDHIVGIIGDTDPNDSINKQIKERTTFRQDNQLQPVVSQKIGSVNNFMGFEDFMTRIGRTGVDTEKFDEWGNALQFNWIPPIDLDKIVNYRDYYWDSVTNPIHSAPQYITIKSQKNWSAARFTQAVKSIVDVIGTTTVDSFDNGTQKLFLTGNHTAEYAVGEHLVVSISDGTKFVVTIANVTYNIATAKTEITTVESLGISMLGVVVYISAIELPTLAIVGNKVTVDGDLSNLLTEGYVIGINTSPMRLYVVGDTTFDPVTNKSVITLNGLALNSFTKVSLYPVIALMEAEKAVTADPEASFPTGAWNDNYIGKVLWDNNTQLTTGTLGSTTLGSPTLTDVTKNFNAFSIQYGDILQILLGSKNKGLYDINSVTATTIQTNTGQFFSASNLNYRVIRPFSFEAITDNSVPASPVLNQLWYNPGPDTLSQYDGSTWNIVYFGVSKLNDLVAERKVNNYSNFNDWSDDNHWVHRSQIGEFTGMIRALMPIIEYFPFLELSETSFSEKVWRYRANDTLSFTETTVEPKMIELMDISFSGYEFSFPTPTTMRFHESFGNFGGELKAGDKVRLSGFTTNDAVYTIASTTYTQILTGQRFVTTLEFTTPIVSQADLPAGSRIEPATTSMGDPFISLGAKHWEFGGVRDIRASSLKPEKNPMLAINTATYVDGQFETIVGLNSQEYSSQGNIIVEPTFNFDTTLHDLVLYDDYQEGDIRVYVNGQRVYGTFEDIGSTSNADFVGGIRFINGYTIYPYDIVRVELGEFAKSDIGRRAIWVNTPIGDELYNLTNIREIEQRKTENNQYPFFALRDIFGERLNLSTNIFKFTESETAPVNVNVLKRVVMASDGTDYTFTQELKDPETDALYCYYDYQLIGDELQTIWKHGTYSEQYVPIKIDGEWEMPNQWYYNVSHRNNGQVKLTEIFRHFKSIIDAQEQPGLFSNTAGLFFLDDQINYGIGGTIKEHNDGFDTLISSTFVNNGNPTTVINFAKNAYDNQVRYVKERYYQEAAEIFLATPAVTNAAELQSAITDSLINFVENNGKYDTWFGDSTSFDGTLGVRNWIATLPQFGLSPRYMPYVVHDASQNLYEVHCHDGHSLSVSFNPAMTEQLIRRIAGGSPSTTQIVASEATPFPTTIDGNPVQNGNYLIRTNTTEKTRKLYRVDSVGSWELIDVNAIFANTILEIEQRLYDVLGTDADVGTFESAYDFSDVETNPQYDDLMEVQFQEYTRREGITTPLNNTDRFRQNNPFTWNYFHSPIPDHPLTGGVSYDTAGTWQALYQNVFETAYPHLEPWKLQGYVNKPLWWEAEYASTVNTRRWKAVMWSNIFNGFIPATRTAPDGTPGTGVNGQIADRYDYLPVNTGNVDTDDGYAPDALLPPYWNTTNTSSPVIRGLYDPNAGQFVTTPQLNFEFGQDGLVEWQWKQSGSYLYDQLIVAYKIDPMRFMHQTFGVDYQIVSCLQISKETQHVHSHHDTIFHGDFIEATNSVYLARGLNQWYVHYNRYSGFDGLSSEFRSLWKDWDTKLSYLVGAFIDTPSFSINNDLFDITTKDYEIAVKKTKGIEDKWLHSLTATMLTVPSPYAKLRDQGIGWTVEINNNTPVARPIEYHPVQNYSVNLNTSANPFRIYSYPIVGADIVPSRAYQMMEFNTPVALSSETGLNPASTLPFNVTFNGTIYHNLLIDCSEAQTFQELFDLINEEFGTDGWIGIENGNVVVSASSVSVTPSVDITNSTLFTAIPGYVGINAASSSPNEFDKIFRITGNFYSTFVEAGEIVITGSTHYNGTYTVTSVFYDSATYETLIFVAEDVTLPATGVVITDGTLEPANAKTLPVEWTTGTTVYLNTTGYLPSNLDDEIPYYVIRIPNNDREFRLAETKEAALNGYSLVASGQSQGEVFVGKIAMTFTAPGGITNYNWRTHAVDYRYVDSSGVGLVISGIQQMVDFLNGYDAFTQTEGFRYKNVNGLNTDYVTGANNNWLQTTEQFINWMYNLRNYNQETMLSYMVTADNTTDSFSMVSGSPPNWGTGTPVVLIASEGQTLPPEFDNPLSSIIPYYVIRDLGNTSFKLAATEYDAKKGNAIELTGAGSGAFRVQMFKPIAQFPTYELNPFKHYIWVENEFGILANVLDDDYTDPQSAARLYDNFLTEMTTADILVYREDKETRISLTEDMIAANNAYAAAGDYTVHMSGMHLFFDGFEHMVRFEDYSVDNTLIYDSFLGLNTPRFYVEFDRQQEFTLRPNVGGFILQGESLVQNFESTVNDMRYYYDSVKAPEGRITTDLVRKSLGYDGPKEYMSDLRINPKTQFQFWQGMIQNKGTNKAVTAFVNQNTFDTAQVDEFWAYKVAEFGDNAEKNYIEMKLFPRDVVKSELRVEFIAPENTPLQTSFEGVELTDMARWWDQPEQIESMRPYQAFFFDAKVVGIVEGVEDYIQSVGNHQIYVAPENIDNAIVTYIDPITQDVKLMTELVDYKFLNSKIIEFLVDLQLYPTLTMSLLSYNYDAQNPAKVIDKDAGVVVANLPIWNPAFGQYYNVPYYAVDLRRDTDPAIYNATLDGGDTGNATWKANHVGTVWMDSSIEDYLPYYDKVVYPDINDRIANWGKLAAWADINLYQWTQTEILPEDYDEISKRQSYDMTIPDANKVTGQVRKLLYLNSNALSPETEDLAPFWVETKDIHYNFFAGLSEQGMDDTLSGRVVDVFVNGVYRETLEFQDANSVNVYFAALEFGDYCHAVARAHVPTAQELEDGTYRYFTPHVVEKKFDTKSGEIKNVYYYWVKDKKQPISEVNPSVSMFSAKRQLVDMSDPYMILQGIRTPDFGYGLIFGHVFDEFAFNLPYRYTQMIAKGLHGTVKDVNRYVIRFTRDFTLRDQMEGATLELTNQHEEWKLFREHQLEKVDRYLWNKVIEALIGFKLNSTYTAPDFNKAIPSLNRILFDRLYQADTQYGMGDEQIFVSKDLGRSTILAVLTNPNQAFEYVNIEEFMSRHDFLTPEDTIDAMNEIYFNFSIEEVNTIFFAVLHDALSLKAEHREIFKTSWVALQISQNVVPSIPVPYDELRLVPGPDCMAPPPSPSPTPSPTTTPIPSMSPTPTPTPTPTPVVDLCGDGEDDRILEDGEGRITEDGECRIVEPEIIIEPLLWAVIITNDNNSGGGE